MERIPQSVAKRVVFRAYLASDGKTPATGKTIAITISKNGAAFGNPAAGATNATAISNGYYYFDLGTGDTGTLGPLAWRGAEGTIDDAGDVFTVSTDVADVWSVATRLLTAGTNIVLAKGTGVTGFNDLSAAQVNAEVDTAISDADLPTAAEIVAAALTTQITEAYRANGAAPTLAQFISEVLSHMGEASISGTTKTINQLDHATPAMTFTLDDATNPSSITRAS